MEVKIILDANKKIYNLTAEQQKEIKDKLTYDNPKYLSALKHARNTKYITIDKYLFYYKQFKDYLEVPRGFVMKDKHSFEDLSIERTVSFPSFLLTLRDTQEQAYKSYIEDTSKGLIVMQTGKGKSILGLYIAFALKQKTLIIVHKDDLVDGWKKDANLCFSNELETGLIKAKKRIIGDQITISTIQTLNRCSEEELNKLYNEFGLVIIDEAHHISASTYSLVNNFRACYKIGLTATPEREDGLKDIMNLYLGDVCFQSKIDNNDSDILPVKIIIKDNLTRYEPMYTFDTNGLLKPSTNDDIRKDNFIKISDLPYKERPKIGFDTVENNVLLNESFMKLVYKDVKAEYKNNHSIIMFFNQKEHLNHYHDYLVSKGITKIQKYYGDSKEPKAVMKERAESKEVLITLATYSIATEGTNVKSWEVAFLIGSLNNGKNVEQAVGRIRRKKDDKINPVLVYDYNHANSYILKNHINTRKSRYRKLKFSINGDKNTLFQRGFK